MMDWRYGPPQPFPTRYGLHDRLGLPRQTSGGYAVSRILFHADYVRQAKEELAKARKRKDRVLIRECELRLAALQNTGTTNQKNRQRHNPRNQAKAGFRKLRGNTG